MQVGSSTHTYRVRLEFIRVFRRKLAIVRQGVVEPVAQARNQRRREHSHVGDAVEQQLRDRINEELKKRLPGGLKGLLPGQKDR